MPRPDPLEMTILRTCQDHRTCRKPKDCMAERKCYFVHAMERHLELHPEDDPMLQPMRRHSLLPLFAMPATAPVVCCQPKAIDPLGICAPDCILHSAPSIDDNLIQFPWVDELEEEPA